MKYTTQLNWGCAVLLVFCLALGLFSSDWRITMLAGFTMLCATALGIQVVVEK